MGVGQAITLIEVGQPADMFQTLTAYAAASGLPAPTSPQFRQKVIGQGGACGNDFDVEEQLPETRRAPQRDPCVAAFIKELRSGR